MTEQATYKIVELRAENIKKLTVVSIKPDGNLVEITGKNGQGKTSVLDSIWWAVAGKGAIQQTPIRNGQQTATIKLDLGEFTVTRKFKAKEGDGANYTSTMLVEAKDGTRPANPQAFLDSLTGDLAFDPLAFSRKPAKEKFEMLQALVPGVDFRAIQKAHDADYAERTVVNRKYKEAEAQVNTIVPPPGVPSAPIDESAIIAELEEGGKFNTELEQRRGRREQAQAAIQRLDTEIERTESDIVALKERLGKLVSDQAELKMKLSAAEELPEPRDLAGIRATLDDAKRKNAGAHAHKLRNELIATAQKLKDESEAITKRIADRIANKEAAIAAAEIPVPGLAFGDEGILLGGVPFEQASDAQQLQASIAIAAALNPRLRVIRVRDGSLLDEDAMKMLAGFADKKDIQVWIERVDNSGKQGFVLEDGHIKAQGA